MKNSNCFENIRYEEIRKATIDCADQKYFDKYYRDTGKRWLDIARVWDKLFTCKKHFVLTSVVHNIMWGVYPYEPGDPKFRYLLELVEEELLRDGEASQAWNKWRTFKSVLAYVTDSTVSFGNSGLSAHFIEHYHYLRDRTMTEIKYSKDTCSELDLGIDACAAYEDTVELLVPAAKNWTREQWGDDRVLANEVETLYSVDFTESWQRQREFGRLINLIRAWRECGVAADVYWHATNITCLPEDIIQLIWPENTADILADILIGSYNLLVDYEKAGEPFADRKDSWIDPLYHFERAALKASWLFKYVREHYYKGTYTGDIGLKIRSIIFDIEMTAA